jgi:hypothetical protein
MVKLWMVLDDPTATEPKERVETPPVVSAAADSDVPVRLTLPLPPGVAEKLRTPLRLPLAIGVKMMRTVHDAPAASVVTPDTQSPVNPLWITKSASVEATLIGPLAVCPVFVMVKL